MFSLLWFVSFFFLDSHVLACCYCINWDLKFYIFDGVYFFLFLQVDPSYRPSLVEGNGVDTQVLPVCGSDLVLSPSQWSSHVVGMILFASPPCDFVLVMNMMGFDLSGKSSFSRKN